MRKLLVLLALSGSLAAQGLESLDFKVQQLFFNDEPLTNFLLGNFGLEGKDAGTEVFRATITNNGDSTVSGLYVHIDFIIASYSSTPIYSSRSEKFSVSPGIPVSFSSMDYFNEQSDGVHWGHTFTTNAAQTKESELQKLLDAGGRLPNGHVEIKLILSQDSHQNPAIGKSGDPIEYDIVNINELHLISPGVPADGYDISLATIQNNTPQFSWISDLLGVKYDPKSSIGSTDRFRIEIFELPTIEQLQEVLNNGVPVHTEDLEPSVYPYPPGAAELRAGQLYAWRVRALLKSATLTEYDDDQMVSEPFVFRIADPAAGQEGGMSPEAAQAAGLLRVLLGEDFSYILKAVEGMEPEGIVYNNQVISMEALADTVYSLTGQGFTVEEIGVTNE